MMPPSLCFCGQRVGITTLSIFSPGSLKPVKLVICELCLHRPDVFVGTTPLIVLAGRGNAIFTKEFKELYMKCNSCGLQGLDSLQSVQMKWRGKKLRLFFCINCIRKSDLFEDLTASPVILDNVQLTPPYSETYSQFLGFIHGKPIERMDYMDYSVFEKQSCTICLRDGFKYAMETQVHGKQALLLFCPACTKKPNIFVDYTPRQVFDTYPKAVLFLTPLFSRYMIRPTKNAAWDDFR